MKLIDNKKIELEGNKQSFILTLLVYPYQALMREKNFFGFCDIN